MTREDRYQREKGSFALPRVVLEAIGCAHAKSNTKKQPPPLLLPFLIQVRPPSPAASAARPGGTSNRPGPPLSGGSSPVHPRGTRQPPRVPSQRPIARASPPNAENPFWVATTHRTDPPPPVLNSEMAIFGPGGYVHVRSRTEKRPSSRPLLLSNRPLFAVYMPYLLSYCAGATSCPDPAVAAPPGPRLCAASVCELRYGPWGVALLLLHLLLLLAGGKEKLAVCHQHKHPCCCCCRRRLFLPPAAFAAAVVAALPSWCSCSGCCPSCAHPPMFLLKGKLCSETQVLISRRSLFKQKALH